MAAVEVATVVVDAGLDPGQILSSITQTLRYSGLLPPTDPVPHGAMKNSKSVPFQVAYTPHPQSTVLQVCSTEVDEFPPYLNQMIFGLNIFGVLAILSKNLMKKHLSKDESM